MGVQGTDIVRIGGRIITRGRALAMGWIDAKGNVTAKAEALFGADALVAGGPVSNKARKAKRQSDDVDLTPDGRLLKRREPKPLKPQNVTHDGEPVTDEAELARIAAETARIEAEKAAAREAGGEG